METLFLMRWLRVFSCINLLVLICGMFFHIGRVSCDESQFSAMFVFGDSLIDNGNNNFLNSYAKANYFPYGIDFYRGPTGRFTNGKTIIDYLAELMGLPYIPPFAHPFANGPRILYGVNYASAAGGILDESGAGLGERFSLSKQVENFGTTRSQIEAQMNDEDFNKHLAKALAVMILGSNDYINNYINPSYNTRSKYQPDQYADLLINQYTRHILALYDQGLRRFFLAGIGAVGCSPGQKMAAKTPDGKCADMSNDVVQMFNTRLKSLVDQLNSTHSDATFIYASTYDALMLILNQPASYGLIEVERACCGMGRNNAEKSCFPLSIPCTNRDQHAWWDAYHPTQVVHKILASMAYNGPSSISYPFNLYQLAQM